MNYKFIGAVFVIAGCGGFGFLMVLTHRKKEEMLRQLLETINFMECQLQYQMTPLPLLCSMASKRSSGCVKTLLGELSKELNHQVSPDVSSCMAAALCAVPELPSKIRQLFQELGKTLGTFDLPGQLKGFEGLRLNCSSELSAMQKNRDVRLRSYQTLGLCAGAALAVLFI